MTPARRAILSWLVAPVLAPLLSKVGLAQDRPAPQSDPPAAEASEHAQSASAPEREPFRPSAHGFSFRNSFTGTPLSLGGLEKRLGAGDTYGLCGGMCFAALDRWHAGESPPGLDDPPEAESPLYVELLARQLDSLGPYATLGLRFMRWMRLPDAGEGGVRHLTAQEIEPLLEPLESGEPAVLGLVYRSEGWHPWGNHQVLAYGLEQPDAAPRETPREAQDEEHAQAPAGDHDKTPGDQGPRNEADEDAAEPPLLLALYDPNFPGRDDVRLRLTPTEEPAARAQDPEHTVRGYRSELLVPGRQPRPVRGVFLMPYAPKAPPDPSEFDPETSTHTSK